MRWLRLTCAAAEVFRRSYFDLFCFFLLVQKENEIKLKIGFFGFEKLNKKLD
jgi:hypothetical protein